MSFLNSNLHLSKFQKNDEFYTLYDDIEVEVSKYASHLKGKHIFCNCNDGYSSNFFNYFKDNFSRYKLKMLTSIAYGGENDLFNVNHGYKITFDGYKLQDEQLKGNGGFGSTESIDILKLCDIIITNPPFSLFRDYIDLLYEHNKLFLIVGNQNALTYKNVMHLIVTNKLWLGINLVEKFTQPNGELKEFGNISWFTNLTHSNRSELLPLTMSYQGQYKKYDNYDAINIDKLIDIPFNYGGTMGCPITFLRWHNPNQFKIVGFRKGNDGRDLRINGKEIYYRVLIKNLLF